MADPNVSTSNNCFLSGGSLGNLIVAETQNFEYTIESSSNDLGNDSRGNPITGSQPGKVTYGDVTFTCPDIEDNIDLLNNWLRRMVTPGKQAKKEPEDLLYTKKSGDTITEQIQLKQAYPGGKSSSGGSSTSSDGTSADFTLKVQALEFGKV